MYVLMSFLFFCTLFLSFFDTKKTRKIAIVIILIFLWIMMAANVDNPDYINYYRGYQSLNVINDTEWGYFILAKFCKNLGFGYHQFKFVISFLGLFLLHKTVSKYLKNNILFYSIYFLCPFMMDVTQLKNFIAMAFFIYAIPFLNENSLVGKLKYILCIVLGASFQITAFIYLPIVFLSKIDKKKLKKGVLYFVVIISILIGLNKNLVISMLSLLSELLGGYDSRISMYSGVSTRYGFLIYWIIQILSFLLVKWAKHVYLIKCHYSSIENLNDDKYNLIKIVEIVNTFSFVFLPFYVVQLTYGRFLRNLLPLNFIVLIFAYQKHKIGKGKITLQGLITLIFLLLYVAINFYFMIYMEYSTTIVEPLFTGNWFFNMEWSKWFE